MLPAPGWTFLQPLTPGAGALLMAIAFVAAGALAVGVLTRSASVAVALCLAYLAHIDGRNTTDLSETLYQLALAGTLLHWQRWLSLDALFCRPKAGAARTSPSPLFRAHTHERSGPPRRPSLPASVAPPHRPPPLTHTTHPPPQRPPARAGTWRWCSCCC